MNIHMASIFQVNLYADLRSIESLNGRVQMETSKCAVMLRGFTGLQTTHSATAGCALVTL